MPFVTGAGIATLLQHGAQVAAAAFMVGGAYIAITGDIEALKRDVSEIKSEIDSTDGEQNRFREKLHKLDKTVTEVQGDIKRLIEKQEDFQRRTDRSLERLINALSNPYDYRRDQ